MFLRRSLCTYYYPDAENIVDVRLGHEDVASSGNSRIEKLVKLV